MALPGDVVFTTKGRAECVTCGKSCAVTIQFATSRDGVRAIGYKLARQPKTWRTTWSLGVLECAPCTDKERARVHNAWLEKAFPDPIPSITGAPS